MFLVSDFRRALQAGSGVIMRSMLGIVDAPAVRSSLGSRHPATRSLSPAGTINYTRPLLIRPSQKTLADNLTVYRYTSGIPRGSPYFTPVKYGSAAEARAALALPESNTAITVREYKILKRPTILEGPAANMVGEPGFGAYAVGGGRQIYVPDPRVVKLAD